jgi:hypothetical protein
MEHTCSGTEHTCSGTEHTYSEVEHTYSRARQRGRMTRQRGRMTRQRGRRARQRGRRARQHGRRARQHGRRARQRGRRARQRGRMTHCLVYEAGKKRVGVAEDPRSGAEAWGSSGNNGASLGNRGALLPQRRSPFFFFLSALERVYGRIPVSSLLCVYHAKRGLTRVWNSLKLPLIVPIRKNRIEPVPECLYYRWSWF